MSSTRNSTLENKNCRRDARPAVCFEVVAVDPIELDGTEALGHGHVRGRASRDHLRRALQAETAESDKCPQDPEHNEASPSVDADDLSVRDSPQPEGAAPENGDARDEGVQHSLDVEEVPRVPRRDHLARDEKDCDRNR